MKKLLTIAVMFTILMVSAISTQAATYTYQPNPADLWDLSHYYAYTWGVEWGHTDEEIIDVTLTFNNIYNWQPEDNWLFIHLLDDPEIGTFRLGDFYNDPTGIDYFDGEGIHIDTWTDPFGGGPGTQLTYSFADLGLVDDFAAFAADGTVGFGIDPDCHYFNDGLELTIVTSAVPEPSSVILIGLGLAGLGLYRRHKSK